LDPGFAIGIGVLWVILNLLGRKKRLPDMKQRPSPTQPSSTLPPSTGQDATQVEGMRLQDLLRELGKTLEDAAGSQRPPSPSRKPATATRPPISAKRPAPIAASEEARSLESTSEVRSLEEDVRRPQRAEVDSDDEAEAIVAKRIAAAEANLRPLSASDHKAFDARIRKEPADATATQLSSMRRLRDAVVWREILGPPVSLRDSDSP
jgi:hypothetical protein